ncbi:sodium:proton antiporter [Beijerinckia indica]|uniref:Citrate transporter n=1 Tax=Beijerinckia indica subsp. indica (strain ATCC 9039 / DSM 1715 / NCIMB 8712) TaxID=395963 RepID=B2IJU0_BEII9|nr:sodium:proton antiporter [Beijerinckia indica]ACB96315.1 Citrate transporter [Beijerinckia indica subsp. indica ATCC 9039]
MSVSPAASVSLSLWQAVPFAGLILSIAVGPLVHKHWWHNHYGKIALAWALCAAAVLMMKSGVPAAITAITATLLHEYMPFILMMFALFTAAGGISIRGGFTGTPFSNVLLLGLGSGLASLIGTTGASMILIRPLIAANAHRSFNVHVVIFFIFLVSNIGGALLPMGDPPLFLGFLHGVDFFWTLRHLWPHTLISIGCLLAVFFLLDSLLPQNRERAGHFAHPSGLEVRGIFNALFILGAVGAIILSGLWHPDYDLKLFGIPLAAEALARDVMMILFGGLSLFFTKRDIRRDNGFDFDPLIEVAKLFAAIFICLVPVMDLLQAGAQGPLAPLIGGLETLEGRPLPSAYFWTTGLLSSFLDNAPTYLVFFELAGGDPAVLMNAKADVLAAISFGAVSMGAMTYIGNAPNFMVAALARKNGIAMPGFLGYLLWSCGLLLPLFLGLTWLFFRIG